MQDTHVQTNARPRSFKGEDAPAASMLAPIIDRVGVPLMWMGIGYLLCKMTQKRGSLV